MIDDNYYDHTENEITIIIEYHKSAILGVGQY